MFDLYSILAQRGNDGQELFWIIAVLLMSALGGLSEWIKNKRGQQKSERPTPPPPDSARIPPRRGQVRLPERPPAERTFPPARPTRSTPPLMRPAPTRTGPLRRPMARPQKPPTPITVKKPPARSAERQATPFAQLVAAEPTQISSLAGNLADTSKLKSADTTSVRTTLAPAVTAPADQVGRVMLANILRTRRDPRALRQAIVLSEILSPPLALRND